MLTIRYKTFETNSSSTHSFAMAVDNPSLLTETLEVKDGFIHLTPCDEDTLCSNANDKALNLLNYFRDHPRFEEVANMITEYVGYPLGEIPFGDNFWTVEESSLFVDIPIEQLKYLIFSKRGQILQVWSDDESGGLSLVSAGDIFHKPYCLNINSFFAGFLKSPPAVQQEAAIQIIYSYLSKQNEKEYLPNLHLIKGVLSQWEKGEIVVTLPPTKPEASFLRKLFIRPDKSAQVKDMTLKLELTDNVHFDPHIQFIHAADFV